MGWHWRAAGRAEEYGVSMVEAELERIGAMMEEALKEENMEKSLYWGLAMTFEAYRNSR